MSQTFPVLIGDIGGTNVRLSLLKISKEINGAHEDIESGKLPTQQYPSLESAIEEFLAKYKNTENYPHYAVIGVPGPVNNNEILKLPNIPHWKHENGDEFAKQLNMKKFIFLNDFTCNAYGVQTNLKLNEDYIIINDVPAQKDGSIGIIGPGSGLGISFLIKNPGDKYYTIGACEGGHMDFFSKSKKLYDLAEFTKKLLGQDLLSIERLCSGQGLIPMYKFLYENEKDIKRDEELGKKIDELNDLKKFVEVDKLNIELVKKGLKDECPLCKKVLELFIEVFGEVSGNISLFCLPTNGLYLVGGLSVVLQNMIKDTQIFMDHFINKDNFEHLLKTFPVYLVKNGNIGVIGAAECARRLILENEN
jgi:glucokinase